MILAIDIGNTNTHLGFFANPNKIIASESIPNTSLNKSFLSKVLDINGGNKIISKVKTILVASTNPEVEPIIIEWAGKIFKIKPLKAGGAEAPWRPYGAQKPSRIIDTARSSGDFDIPIINRTDAPTKVGKDRLLNALAARQLVKGKHPILVISCGTAITFDIVNSRGEFLGGVIAPGISMMAKSLYQNCAQLPWVKLPSKRPVALGKNTQDAIISGVYHGGAGLVKNIVQELVKTIKVKPSGLKIVLTGGDAEIVKSAIPFKTNLVPYLTLRGLVHAYLSTKGR
ncbi:MAG: type III pantothenate kinase [Planctomycetes bacterium]|nr:type III pantothenate kinase [Planctomycetota bacterium]